MSADISGLALSRLALRLVDLLFGHGHPSHQLSARLGRLLGRQACRLHMTDKVRPARQVIRAAPPVKSVHLMRASTAVEETSGGSS